MGTYELDVQVLEVVAPGAPTDSAPTRPGPGHSLAVWSIGRGVINGVDVGGSTVVVVTHRSGPPAAGVRVILLDEETTPEQCVALVDGFQGRLGGPLAQPTDEAFDTDGFAQVPITGWVAREGSVVWVPDRLHVTASFGPLFGRPSTLPSVHPGVVDMGTALDVQVRLLEYGLRWQWENAPAIYQASRLTWTSPADRGELAFVD
jgi:hypothetical protein